MQILHLKKDYRSLLFLMKSTHDKAKFQVYPLEQVWQESCV